MALATELAVYRANLDKLLAEEGKLVVIKGDDIAGTYVTIEQALTAGYARYGPVPFLVKQIHPTEPVLSFSRDLPRRSV